MNQLLPVGIRGTGSCLPEKVLDNAAFEEMVDTSDEWITTRTGIKERHVLADDEATSDLAVVAGRRALEAAAIEPDEIDLVVVATVSPDSPFPAVAGQVQHALGLTRAAGFDQAAACSGFIYGFTSGWQYLRSGMYKNALIIGAEGLSRYTNYDDRTSCILFGDGAGAVVLSSDFERGEVLGAHLRVDGSGYKTMWVPAGGSRTPLTPELIDARQGCMVIHGREVYRFAVSHMVELVQGEIDSHPEVPLGLVVPHQVNMRIIEAAREKLSIPRDRVVTNIDRVGNTGAASIPIALDEAIRAGRLDEHVGELMVFCAFGAGLTWGSFSVKW